MPRKTPGQNVKALAIALKALTGLTDEHAALVAQAKVLAGLVDELPSDIDTHREYRTALHKLVELGKPKTKDVLRELLEEIRQDK